jgi:CDP-diglyceride synthetase
MHVWLILQLLVLLAAANGAPVVAKKIFGSRWAWPLDGGLLFFDGHPLFGKSKTVRGVVAALVLTSACALALGLAPWIGVMVALSAMAGDLVSSFTKRRLNRPPSSQATGLDQVPESLLPALVCYEALALSILDVLAIVAVFFVGEVLLSRVLYRYHLRDRPY